VLPFATPLPRPWIVAHRGASSDAPENTLAAFRLAVEQGADMIETDLQLTADGELVAFHDRDLERLTGAAGAVEESPLARLRALEVGGQAIPTLGELLAALPPALPLDLELKRRLADPVSLATALAAAIAGSGRPLLVSSFDWALLERVRALLPSVSLAPLAKSDPLALVSAGERLAAAALAVHRRLASAAWIDLARFRGRPVLAYTVNRADAARRLLELGVAGLFTDRPGELRREIGGGG